MQIVETINGVHLALISDQDFALSTVFAGLANAAFNSYIKLSL